MSSEGPLSSGVCAALGFNITLPLDTMYTEGDALFASLHLRRSGHGKYVETNGCNLALTL